MMQDRNKQGGKRLQKTAEPSRGAAAASTGAAVAVKKPFYKRPVFIVLIVLAVLAGGLTIFWKVFSAPPEMEPPPTRPAVVKEPVYTMTVDPNTGKETEIPVDPQPVDTDLKKEFYTFLLFGQDTLSGLTDTMMLCAYDVPNQELNLMSLPRDTLVDYKGSKVVLNTVYNRAGGKKQHETAAKALKNEVGEMTGVYPNFEVLVQWEAFGELVDAIGGVDFDVPRNMKYDDPDQGLHINQAKGYRHLSGDDAMQVIRWRHNNDGTGYVNADLGRVQTQQALMKAIIEKCLDPAVLLSNLGEYITIFQKNVQTNLSVSDMTYFAKSAIGGLKMDNVGFATMPCKASGARVVPAGKELLEIINERFNPYVDPLRLDELDIEGGATSQYITGGVNDPSTGNSSGGSSSGGSKATAKPASKATPKPAKTAKPTVKPTAKPTAKPSGGNSATPKPVESKKPVETVKPSAAATERPVESPEDLPPDALGPAGNGTRPPSSTTVVIIPPRESDVPVPPSAPAESSLPEVPESPAGSPSDPAVVPSSSAPSAVPSASAVSSLPAVPSLPVVVTNPPAEVSNPPAAVTNPPVAEPSAQVPAVTPPTQIEPTPDPDGPLAPPEA